MFADLAPYLLTHKLSQGLPNCNQTKAWMNLETTVEEEKEEEETAKLTSFRTNESMQTESSTEHESTENPLHFDMVKNGMAQQK